MTQPTTTAEKYSPTVQDAQLAAEQRRIVDAWQQLHADRKRLQELMEAAMDGASAHRERFYAAKNTLTQIRNVAHSALGDVEGAHVAALSRALAEVAQLAARDL